MKEVRYPCANRPRVTNVAQGGAFVIATVQRILVGELFGYNSDRRLLKTKTGALAGTRSRLVCEELWSM